MLALELSLTAVALHAACSCSKTIIQPVQVHLLGVHSQAALTAHVNVFNTS